MKFKMITYFFCFGLLISCGKERPSSTRKKTVSKTSVAKTSQTESEKKEDSHKLIKPNPEQIKKANEIIKSVTESDLARIDAKKKFKMMCATCHGIKGNMMINGAKDLTKSTIPLDEAVSQIYFGKGLMTPFKGVLKDAEIIAVAKYSESLRN